MKYDTIIVGGGIAGLTAAAYVARAGRSVLLMEKQEKVGGLVQTFERNGVFFDSGLRSIEDSGIVFPMLRQLGIQIDFVKSDISVGIGQDVLTLQGEESLDQYENFLKSHYPDFTEDVSRIVAEIRKIMHYMDVLYAIDNPAFLNLMKDKKYLLKVILPWIFTFLMTVRKIENLKEPVEDYLQQLTSNQPLIDMIAQHFFQKTPTSFALSYFRLYLDYYYPKGGTATLMDKMEDFILTHGGEIKTSTRVESLHPEEQFVIDEHGDKIEYSHLVWAGDMKTLYNCIPLDQLKDTKLIRKIEEKKNLVRNLKGGDSVFTVYLTVNEDMEYFRKICTGHFFYTPVKTGLSTLNKEDMENLLKSAHPDPKDDALKKRIKDYLKGYCELNTFEIAIPVLRDKDLAPAGKTGLIVSLLFDYQLTNKLEVIGWLNEMKTYLEQLFIDILNQSIYPGIKDKVIGCFSSSPLTIKWRTGNTDGGITGWAFTNPIMPAVNKTLKVAKSVETPLPNVYQAGQWVFSPSGLPISILTGKLASDKVLKK